jgi:DNA-binding CsgD family transcriptional regulator
MSAHASGAILLANRDPRAALGPLRRACAIWRSLGVPYGLARSRVLFGHACRELGDEDTATLELHAARSIYQRLGAAVGPPADATVDAGDGVAPVQLTQRELDVLRLVATGMTNRAIADQLGLSEKTIARHISNILAKLGLRSRSAATAYAYRHHLT